MSRMDVQLSLPNTDSTACIISHANECRKFHTRLHLNNIMLECQYPAQALKKYSAPTLIQKTPTTQCLTRRTLSLSSHMPGHRPFSARQATSSKSSPRLLIAWTGSCGTILEKPPRLKQRKVEELPQLRDQRTQTSDKQNQVQKKMRQHRSLDSEMWDAAKELHQAWAKDVVLKRKISISDPGRWN